MKLHQNRPSEDNDPVAIYRAVISGRIKRVTHRMWQDADAGRRVLQSIWDAEHITLSAVPRTCTVKWLNAHRLAGLMRYYRGSPYVLLTTLFPSAGWQGTDFRHLPIVPDIKRVALQVEGIDYALPVGQRQRLVNSIRSRKLHRCRACTDPLPEAHTSRLCPSCLARDARYGRERRQRD